MINNKRDNLFYEALAAIKTGRSTSQKVCVQAYQYTDVCVSVEVYDFKLGTNNMKRVLQQVKSKVESELEKVINEMISKVPTRPHCLPAAPETMCTRTEIYTT